MYQTSQYAACSQKAFYQKMSEALNHEPSKGPSIMDQSPQYNVQFVHVLQPDNKRGYLQEDKTEGKMKDLSSSCRNWQEIYFSDNFGANSGKMSDKEDQK